MNKIIIIAILVIAGCVKDDPSDQNSSNNSNTNEWLIPISSVRDGGPGKDGIPSVDSPKFAAIENTQYLRDNELVLVRKSGNVVRVYPHQVLDWHEIINDQTSNDKLAVSYCPLTGSGMGWNRELYDGYVTTFGVSGLLYKSNLMPYDRRSNSTWSQLRLDCVNGSLIGTEAKFIQLVETNWKTVKIMYPSAEVLTTDTGFERPYGVYPYGDYKESDRLIFTVGIVDDRLDRKERVLALINDNASKVYRFEDFEDGTKIIEDNIGNHDYIIIGNKTQNYIVAFLKPEGDISFSSLTNAGDIIMEDSLGNKWNIFGEAVDGPDSGMILTSPVNFIAYWFSVAAFYPEVEIYNGI